MIDKNDPRLTAFVLGELAREEHDEIKSAVDASDELKAVVDEIRETIDSVQSVYAAQPECGLEEKQRAEILAATSGGKPQRATAAATGKASAGISGLKAGLVALAAVLLIGITVVLVNPGLVDNFVSPVAQTNGTSEDSDDGDSSSGEMRGRSGSERGEDGSSEGADAAVPGSENSTGNSGGFRGENNRGGNRGRTDRNQGGERNLAAGGGAAGGMIGDEGEFYESSDDQPVDSVLLPGGSGRPAPSPAQQPSMAYLEEDELYDRSRPEMGADFDSGGDIAGQSGEIELRGGMNFGTEPQSNSFENGDIMVVEGESASSAQFGFPVAEAPALDNAFEAVAGNQQGGQGQPMEPMGGRGFGGGGLGGGGIGGGGGGGRLDVIDEESSQGREAGMRGANLDEAGEALEFAPQITGRRSIGGESGQGDPSAGLPAVDSQVEFNNESSELARELFDGIDPTASREILLRRLEPDSSNENSAGYELRLRDRLGRQMELNGQDEFLADAGERFRGLALESGLEAEISDEDLIEFLADELERRNEEIRRQRTWRRSRATPNASRLMIGDNDELDLQGMEVNVQVEGFRARVLIDCFYYNDRSQQLEGNFKLRLPDDASLYYFAFGQSVIDYRNHEGEIVGINGPASGMFAEEEFLPQGQQFVALRPEEISRQRQDTWENVKEARMVQKERAAHAYTQTVRRRVDPALVEWAGAGVFNARVFPIMPGRQHRIVIGYDVDLKKTADGWTYELDLPEFAEKCRVSVDVLQVPDATMTVFPEVKPEELESDEFGYHWRYSFNSFDTDWQERTEDDEATNEEDGERDGAVEEVPARRFVRLTLSDTGPVLLRSDAESDKEFFATRVFPELPAVEAAANPYGIFLLDTSLSSQPDKFNVWLNMLRQTLDANRDSMTHFNVLFFNVENHFWNREGYVENTEENVEALIERCEQLALEGATDLYSAIRALGEADWVSADEVKPDLFLLSDGAANWGEMNQQLTVRQFADHGLGSLFAYQTGYDGTAIANLRFIAGQTGGAVFSISSEAEIETARTAHRNRPWMLQSIEVDGGTDVLTAGRVKWIYPGQPLTVVGRVVDGGAATLGGLRLNLSQGTEEKSIDIAFENELQSTLASRIYGAVSVGQLESLGETLVDVSTAYARHFRITGSTCSLLMLESEEDYQRFDIKPEEDLFVIESKDAGELIEKTLEEKAAELKDPHAQLIAWLDRLESMPGIEFEMPTALGLVLEDLDVVAISESLNCEPALKSDQGEAYAEMLLKGELDYSMVRREAIRRSEIRAGGNVSGMDTIDPAFADEAIKVMSNLVEMNAGDDQLARDVAFTAMELNRPAQAYHLLRRVVTARPFDPSVYAALGQCLTQLGQADMAMIYYEIAVTAGFPNRGADYSRIAATDYVHLLNQISNGSVESSAPEFAAARMRTLTENLDVRPRDLVVTMMWNTDNSDVDLHIIEPSGEECFYQHQQTRSGGLLSRDITDGYGPEMFTLTNAPEGDYQVLVNYYADNQNRTDMRSKVYLTIYRNFGRADATVIQRTIELSKVGGKQMVETLTIKK
ncbi:MAG: hypothetical protein AAF456_20850 [Planctomycetota bacterium]